MSDSVRHRELSYFQWVDLIKKFITIFSLCAIFCWRLVNTHFGCFASIPLTQRLWTLFEVSCVKNSNRQVSGQWQLNNELKWPTRSSPESGRDQKKSPGSTPNALRNWTDFKTIIPLNFVRCFCLILKFCFFIKSYANEKRLTSVWNAVYIATFGWISEHCLPDCFSNKNLIKLFFNKKNSSYLRPRKPDCPPSNQVRPCYVFFFEQFYGLGQ